MALNSYSALQDSVMLWLARPGDPLISGTVPDMITMFEEEARDRLKTRFAETKIDLTPAANSDTLSLPDDFASLREAWVDAANGGTGRQPLFFHTPSNLDTQVWRCQGGTFAFTIEGLTMRFVGNSGDTPGPIHLNYMQGIPALGAAAASNWLLRQYPSAYLFGSLSLAEAFIGDDERISGWVNAREATFARIALADRKARFTGGPLVIMSDIYGGSRGAGGGAAPSAGGGGTPVPPVTGRGTPITIVASGSVAPIADQSVYVANASAAPLTVTVQPGSYLDQRITIKDTAGNAGTFAITVVGPPGTTIDGNASMSIPYDFGSMDLVWLGSGWGTW